MDYALPLKLWYKIKKGEPQMCIPHQKPARAIALEINRSITNNVGNTIKVIPEYATLGPLSACRSIPAGGVEDITLGMVGAVLEQLWEP